MKAIKKQKKLDESAPGIFDDVAAYLLAKQQAKDKENNKIIKEFFNKSKS